ncbi:MAG: permease [Steroidobacteraceae bacterium]|nr:permease [Deltaproteobacteria bacterium]
MFLNLFKTKPKDTCQVHGSHDSHGNWMLIGMTVASIALIAWHVWVHGLSGHALPSANVPGDSFPTLFGKEIWDLLFNKHGIFSELGDVLPYFLAGVLLAGYLRTFKVAVKLQSSLRKYGIASVFLASFVGIITPLCACGTLTTAISLLMAGIPLAPVMSLMVTSPLLSPSTYLLTLNDLGPEWTVIRTISAYSMGVFAGLVAHYMSKRAGFTKNDIFIEGAITRGDFHDDDYPDERLRCNCRRNFGNRVAVNTGNKFLVFLAKSSEMLWVVGKYVLVGVVVGAVVERYLPTEWIYRFFGRKDPLNILWITLASVPMFLHQVSASSILSHIKSALDGTLDGGAALAFMIGGPVTAVPTMVLFWTFFRKRVFVLYMFVCLSGTLLIAYSFQTLVFVPGVDLGNPLMKGVGSISGGPSAIIHKSGTNTRMVMDPNGKGVIATYTNDVDGHGAIVFDASPARFSTAFENSYDNRKYILNIAGWLEQSVNSQPQKRILIYTLTDKTPLGDTVLAELAKEGYTVKEASRIDTPKITERLLSEYSQLWLFFDGRRTNGLSEDELQLISNHNSKSKGTLVVASPLPGTAAGQPANQLSARYGISFSGSMENEQKLKVSVASNIFNSASELLGAFLKKVNKA